MAKLPTAIRTHLSDVKGSPPWFTRFLGMQNTFNQAIYEAINGQITFIENVRAQFKEFTFTTESDYSLGTWNQISFANELKTKAMSMTICQIYKTDLTGVIKNAVTPDWKDINGNIVIYYIAGLEDLTSYFLRIMLA